MRRNVAILVFAISAASLLGSDCSTVATPPAARPPMQIILPDGYVGWVEVNFQVTSAPKLRSHHKVLTLSVPESGVVETQSPEWTVFGTSDYHLYYESAGKTVPVPQELYAHDLMKASLFKHAAKVSAGTWYFFVGPTSLRGNYPQQGPLRDAPAPTPGRITTPANPQNN